MKRQATLLAAMVLAVAAGAANAAVSFVNLGTTAPPGQLGPYTVTAFDQVAQAGIPNGTSVSTVFGGPAGTAITLSAPTEKATVPAGGWNNWSHGYTGAVYFTTESAPADTRTIMLPPGTKAFYFYTEHDDYVTANVTVTPAGGAPVTLPVTTPFGATGFGFYTSGEDLLSVTVSIPPSEGDGFAIGEFGLALGAAPMQVPALDAGALAALALLLGGAGLWAQRRRQG